MVRQMVKKLVPERVRRWVRPGLPAFSQLSFSQEGEDIVLARIFQGRQSGFYVDVGAHHPQRFSNTYFFYLRGWQGINIDAMPDSMRQFRLERPRDINLEIGISETRQQLVYYMFNEPALNGFQKDLAISRDGVSKYQIEEERSVQTIPLADVLAEHLPFDTPIDFLTVDVEGLDFEVVRSNNWTRYRPKMVLAEIFGLCAMAEVAVSPLGKYLESQHYQLACKIVNTSFFRAEEFPWPGLDGTSAER